MSTLVAVALTVGAAVIQLAVTSSVDVPATAPLLCVAVLGAWACVRGPAGAWVAVLPAALVLGVASEVRTGWFVLALLPAPLLATLPRRSGGARTLALASAAGGGGALAYLALLGLAAGRAYLPPAEAEAIAGTALRTALGTLGLAACLLPFRPRERGLFW